MKTFDLAIEYLKDFDFSKFNPYDQEKCSNEAELLIVNNIEYPDNPVSICHTEGSESDDTYKKLQKVHELFLKDKRNIHSNDNWKGMVMTVAFYHCAEKSIKETSIFEVAIAIIASSYRKLGRNPKLYKNTVYPKIIFDKFIDYCEKLTPQPYYLSDDAEVRDFFFMVAYHYLID